MRFEYCLPVAIVLVTAYMFMDSAYENWRAAELQHEFNKRGWIGCEKGHFLAKNFDFDGLSIGEVFFFPEGKDPCLKN